MTRCRACAFENPPGMRFCGNCGQPLPVAAQPDAERRQITVMFCDLVGSSALADRLDPEELRDLIQHYQQAAGEAIRAFDGHVAQHLGDGLLVYFGYPRAHEDDARRAVHAGLAVLVAVDKLNGRLSAGQRLAVRIGVHTGPVVTGEVGAGTTRERLALGATPNVAARLQEVAGAGALVVSAQTRRLLGAAVQSESLGIRALKGMAEPIEVFRVSGLIETRPTPTFEWQMVGREAELAALAAAFARVETGHGETAMVVAEAGLGKSRLVRAFQDRIAAEPCDWYETQCSPYEQASALRPVASLVRRQLQLAEGETLDRLAIDRLASAAIDPAEAVPLVAALLDVAIPDGYEPLDVSPQKQRARMMEVASSLLLARTAATPAVVLFEDLHWADPSTVEFLQLLAERSRNTRALILVTSRPADASWPHSLPVTELRLSAATAADIERIIASVSAGRPIAPAIVTQIVEKADGVPLFAEELTKAVVESGGLARSAPGASETDVKPTTIPVSLQASLTARLDRLPSGKDVVQLASVIGRQFSLAMLKAVSDRPEDDLRRDLDRLVELQILSRPTQEPHAAYVFRHALIQDAAYQMLLKRTRAQYHGRVAAALVERFPDVASTRPELIAQHLTQAGEAARAAGYWLHAGQRAMRQSANLEAVSHLQQGLALIEALPESAQRDSLELPLRTALGSVLVFTQGYTSAEVEATYLRAQELSNRAGDAASHLWITIGIWTFRIVRGELEEAARLARQLLDRADDNDPQSLARSELLVAWSDFYRGAFADASRHTERALAHMGASDSDFLDHLGVDSRTNAHAFAALILWHLGDLEASRAHSERALQLARDSHHAYSLVTTIALSGVEASTFRRDLDDVRRYAAELLRLCEQHGFPMWMPQALVALAWADAMIDTSSVDGSPAPDPVGIIAAMKAAGARLAVSYFSTLAAEALLWRGRLNEASAAVDDALSLVNSTGDRMWAAETHRIKADVLRRLAGDRPGLEARREVASFLERAIDIARQQGSRSLELRAGLDLARHWRDEGREADARQLLAPICERFPAQEMAPEVVDARAFLAAGREDGLPHAR